MCVFYEKKSVCLIKNPLPDLPEEDFLCIWLLLSVSSSSKQPFDDEFYDRVSEEYYDKTENRPNDDAFTSTNFLLITSSCKDSPTSVKSVCYRNEVKETNRISNPALDHFVCRFVHSFYAWSRSSRSLPIDSWCKIWSHQRCSSNHRIHRIFNFTHRENYYRVNQLRSWKHGHSILEKQKIKRNQQNILITIVLLGLVQMG